MITTKELHSLNKVDTTPTERVIHGIPVKFYSPVQIEAIVPVERRLTPSSLHGSIFTTPSAVSTGRKMRHGVE